MVKQAAAQKETADSAARPSARLRFCQYAQLFDNPVQNESLSNDDFVCYMLGNYVLHNNKKQITRVKKKTAIGIHI